jgi:hypothetical protein
MRSKPQTSKSAQEIQDEIFRKMSADRKLEIGSQLWKLAKKLAGDKIRYGGERPKASFSQNRRSS